MFDKLTSDVIKENENYKSKSERDRAKIQDYEKTLTSIVKNSCCGKCQEASLWAKAVLEKHEEKGEKK